MNPLFTPAGFASTTIEQEVEDLNAKIHANVDAGLDLDERSTRQGHRDFAEKFTELTALGASAYAAIDPEQATGQQLVNVCAISGTNPQTATYSFRYRDAHDHRGTTVHIGAVAGVANQPGNTWVLTADVVNTKDTTQALPGVFRSEQPGVFTALASTLTIIATPIVGWSALTNATDSTPGLPADRSDSLRARRFNELAGEGGSDTAAIAADVRKSDTAVLDAFGFESTGLLPDATGLPGKSVRVVVWDGFPTAGDQRRDRRRDLPGEGGGIVADGATTVQVTDAAGTEHAIPFDHATARRLYVSCTTTPGTLTIAQTAAVKAAIVAFGAKAFTLGAGSWRCPS